MRRCNCSNYRLDSSSNYDPLQGKLPESTATRKNKIQMLSIGLFLSGGFSLFEWTAGWWSHSLSLMTDAGHMLADCLALSLAIGAAWMAHLAIKQKDAIGPQTAEIAAALANGIGLLILAVWVVWEAVNRIHGERPAIVGELMLVTAIVGLCINIIAASVLHNHSQHDLNVRGAFLHVLADTVSSAGVIVSAVLIWAFHWNWIDEVISIGIAAILGIGSLPLIFDSFHSLRKASAANRG